MRNTQHHTGDQNISYYNEIAGVYDDLLQEDLSNAIVRKMVQEKFTAVVTPGWVLDFGGGTGQDIAWLRHNYTIFFCEPAAAMRAVAEERARNNSAMGNIFFLDAAKIDFKTWHKKLPFEQKVNAVLANFAVFNCIAAIDILFQNLALVMQSGGHIIAVMLNNKPSHLLQQPLRFIRHMVTGKQLTTSINYKEQQQVVFNHTVGEIKKAARKYFIFQSITPVKDSGFMLLHLTKK